MPRPRSTVADHPEQLAVWDTQANLPVTADQAGHGSSRRYAWRCPVADDHTWTTSAASIARSLSKGFTGCPACAGRQVSVTNSLATRFPDIAAQWHPDLNGDLTPETVNAGREQKAWWRCPEGPDHEWRALISSRTKAGVGCPFCAGKRASVTNSVATSDLADEWHPTKNLPATADEVVAGTNRKLWWLCADDPSHEWRASGANRVKGRGCPYCRTYQRSTLEICLAYELADFFPTLDLTDDKIDVDGRIRHVDLLIRDLRVAVEVDGRYHHEGREADDRRKTEQLTAAGWHVIRLREAPLEPLGPDDVQLPQDPSTKQTADVLLTALAAHGYVDQVAVDVYVAEWHERHLAAALAEVQRRRPGKVVHIPGTPPGPSRKTVWETRYAALLRYVDREGHGLVPYEHTEDGQSLGHWVSTQRSRWRRGKQDADRVARLAAVPGWSWDPVSDAWEDGFNHLLAFLDREGHVRVQAHHVEPDGYALGSWVRSHRRRGGRRTMTDEQAARLEAVPGWSYDTPADQHWDRAYAALCEFAAANGHVRAPDADGLDLRGWVALQRQRYKNDELDEDRAQRLEQVPGWEWDPQAAAWDNGYDTLLRFVERTGHALVPREHCEDGYPLGQWVGEQRLSRDDLSDDRRDRVEALPGWSWAPHEDRWEHMFALLERFVAGEGHAAVPTGHIEEGERLGSWVIWHRQERKNGRVPVDRVVRLEALPGWVWDTREARWDANYEALLRFVEGHGHARVPYGHVVGEVRLGAWVVSQRASHRDGKLRADRVARLEQVLGWLWDGRPARAEPQDETLF